MVDERSDRDTKTTLCLTVKGITDRTFISGEGLVGKGFTVLGRTPEEARGRTGPE